MSITTDTQASTIEIPGDGVTLVADAYGDPTNPPVVLLHGGGQTRHSWRHTGMDLAAGGWYAVAVDQRGHGESGWSADGRYSLTRFANDIVTIVEYLGTHPVLVGASLGGAASLAALGEQPTLALGLVLVDVAPFIRIEGASRIRRFMTATPDGFGSVSEAADAVAAYLPHRPRPRNLDGLRRNLREADGRLFWHWDPELLANSMERPVQRNTLMDPARLAAAAAALRVPTLLVRGGQSDVLGIDEVRHFLDAVPHAEFTSIDGAHHMVAGDDNAVFGALLGDFLERRVRSRLVRFVS